MDSMSKRTKNQMNYVRRVNKVKRGGLIFYLYRFDPAAKKKFITELDYGGDSEWDSWEKEFDVNFYNEKKQLDQEPLRAEFGNKTFHEVHEKENNHGTMNNTNDAQIDVVPLYDSFNLDESMNCETVCAESMIELAQNVTALEHDGMNMNSDYGNNSIENAHNTVDNEKEKFLDKIFDNVGKDPSNSGLLISEEDEKEELERQKKKG